MKSDHIILYNILKGDRIEGVDFSQTIGKMKLKHVVNNGLVYKFAQHQRITSIHAFCDKAILRVLLNSTMLIKRKAL